MSERRRRDDDVLNHIKHIFMKLSNENPMHSTTEIKSEVGKILICSITTKSLSERAMREEAMERLAVMLRSVGAAACLRRDRPNMTDVCIKV